MAWLLWCAWRYGGHDPYALYHHGSQRGPSPFPGRVQTLIFGFSDFAAEREIELAGGKVRRRALR